MRKSKFTDQEIGNYLEKIEKGASIEEISKKAGVTIATVYNWKKKQSASAENKNVSVSGRLKQLEEENLKLKQLIANLSLEKQDLIELLKKKGTI